MLIISSLREDFLSSILNLVARYVYQSSRRLVCNLHSKCRKYSQAVS